MSGLQGSESVHCCVSNIQINEQAIFLYASLPEPWLIIPESVGKMGKEWLPSVPIESFLRVWTTGTQLLNSWLAQPQTSSSLASWSSAHLSCIGIHVTILTSHWLEGGTCSMNLTEKSYRKIMIKKWFKIFNIVLITHHLFGLCFRPKTVSEAQLGIAAGALGSMTWSWEIGVKRMQWGIFQSIWGDT